MRSRFTYYYRYERVFHKDSINKYELMANVGNYHNFNDETEIKAFHTILYQPEKVAIHKIKKQGLHTLTVLVPWEKEEKIGIMNVGDDAIVIIAKADYQTIEMFIAINTQVTYFELCQLFQGKFYSSIESIRQKAGCVS